MAYKVLDLYKDLPLTNCGDCGKGGCFAFASAAYLEGASLALCPHLEPGKRDAMEAKLEQGRARGDGRRPESSEQAFAFLKGKLAQADFAGLARASGAVYESGPPEALLLDFLGARHRLTRDDVEALQGEEPTVWVKIFLAIYVTRASGAPPAGEWAAYRELPNTVSKARSFEACGGKVADGFRGRTGDLDAACRGVGGVPTAFGSADRAYLLPALPRVSLVLLYWEPQEEFGARATFLVDRGVLEYLDQEALVFLAEATTQRLLGKGLAEVIP
ncbi:MAG: DUF3786 domain-containing protein [Proteobacteria bacterium]|nr:DUF3786 domain-containing protein [Pseudomonadota bacterium]